MRALGPVAQERPRVARVDDLLDPEALGRAERRADGVQPRLDLGAQRGRVVGRFELAPVGGLDARPRSAAIPSRPTATRSAGSGRSALPCAAPATPKTLRTRTDTHGTVAW